MTIGIIGGQRLLLAAMLASQENNQLQPIAMTQDKPTELQEINLYVRKKDRWEPTPKSRNQKENQAKADKNRAAKRRRKSR